MIAKRGRQKSRQEVTSSPPAGEVLLTCSRAGWAQPPPIARNSPLSFLRTVETIVEILNEVYVQESIKYYSKIDRGLLSLNCKVSHSFTNAGGFETRPCITITIPSRSVLSPLAVASAEVLHEVNVWERVWREGAPKRGDKIPLTD